MNTSTESVRAVAYHEAGHAVAALSCGLCLRTVQVKLPGGPDIIASDGRSLNDCTGLTSTSFKPVDPHLLHAERPGDRRSEQVKILNQVYVDGAGLAAEAKYRHLSRDQVFNEGAADTDLDHSMRRLKMLGFSWEQARTVAWEIWDATVRLTTSGDAWGAVEAIAEAALNGHGRDGQWITEFGRALLPGAPTSPLGHALYVPERLFERLRQAARVA